MGRYLSSPKPHLNLPVDYVDPHGPHLLPSLRVAEAGLSGAGSDVAETGVTGAPFGQDVFSSGATEYRAIRCRPQANRDSQIQSGRWSANRAATARTSTVHLHRATDRNKPNPLIDVTDGATPIPLLNGTSERGENADSRPEW